jgi:GMP synthase-like glutamine amidotransferase
MLGSRPVNKRFRERKHPVKPVAVFQFYKNDGACFFGDHLRSRGVPIQVFELFRGQEAPASLEAFSGLSLLGGPMSVNDDWDALRQTERLVNEALRGDIPTFGHCLGGQLISRALGGRVRAAEFAEIGWSSILAQDHPLARYWFGQDAFPMFQWHNETFSIPAQAELIATGEYCRQQAFAIGELHVGVQFHCEIDRDKIECWLVEQGSEEIERFGSSPAVSSREAIRLQTDAFLEHGQRVSAHLYDRWIERLVR